MFNLSAHLPNREEGQGLVEYALILVLVAVVVIAILLVLGPAVQNVYCEVAEALQPGSCVAQAETGPAPQVEGPWTWGGPPVDGCAELGLSGSGETMYVWSDQPPVGGQPAPGASFWVSNRSDAQPAVSPVYAAFDATCS
jgi:pilus assembly protein Flp/PilA